MCCKPYPVPVCLCPQKHTALHPDDLCCLSFPRYSNHTLGSSHGPLNVCSSDKLPITCLMFLPDLYAWVVYFCPDTHEGKTKSGYFFLLHQDLFQKVAHTHSIITYPSTNVGTGTLNILDWKEQSVLPDLLEKVIVSLQFLLDWWLQNTFPSVPNLQI